MEPNDTKEDAESLPPITNEEVERWLEHLRRTGGDEHASKARLAITAEALTVMGARAMTPAIGREIAVAVRRTLEEFERGAPEALAQHQRELEARQQTSAAIITEGARFQRERARAAARANPLPANEILRRVEQSGFQIRLHQGNIQVAPDFGLALELEAYLIQFADLIATQLAARESWRSVAKVTVHN
jgi:hypothetical protein